jgi:hypothetical protein
VVAAEAAPTAAEAGVAAELAAEPSAIDAALGAFRREEEGGPRDQFLRCWLEEREGHVALPEAVDGAETLLGALLELDPQRRGGRGAAELLRTISFLKEEKAAARLASSQKSSSVARRGRWYGVTGASCDGCGLPILELRHSCVECESFDFCTACFESKQRAEPKEHPHEMEASRDVSAYAWFETDEQAEAARRRKGGLAAASGRGGSRKRRGWAAAASRGLGRLSCRVAPARESVVV